MARRSASARPIAGSDLRPSKVEVVSRTAAFESTAQCETRSARGPSVEKGAGQAGQSFGAGFVTGRSVAGGEHNPVSIELQLRDPDLCHLAEGRSRKRQWPLVALAAASHRHRSTVRRGNLGHRHNRQSHAEKMSRLEDAIPGDPQRAWQRRPNPRLLNLLRFAPESTDLARGQQAVVEFAWLLGSECRSEGSPSPLMSPATSPWVAK